MWLLAAALLSALFDLALSALDAPTSRFSSQVGELSAGGGAPCRPLVCRGAHLSRRSSREWPSAQKCFFVTMEVSSEQFPTCPKNITSPRPHTLPFMLWHLNGNKQTNFCIIFFLVVMNYNWWNRPTWRLSNTEFCSLRIASESFSSIISAVLFASSQWTPLSAFFFFKNPFKYLIGYFYQYRFMWFAGRILFSSDYHLIFNYGAG